MQFGQKKREREKEADFDDKLFCACITNHYIPLDLAVINKYAFTPLLKSRCQQW
jgi:hypothetical protein